MFKNPGFNNSGMAKLPNGGYDINVLLSRAGYNALSKELASDFAKTAEVCESDEELQRYILHFANALYGACKLHAGDLELQKQKNSFYAWSDKLEEFMADKEQEVFAEDDADYDVGIEDFYFEFYPNAYAEFVKQHPKPTRV